MDSNFLIKKKLKKNRMPIDTPLAIHRKANKAMKELGYKARRNNSIFTTKSPTSAAGYGDIYCVFPIGNFSYLYSNQIDDFFKEIVMGNIQDILVDEFIIDRSLHVEFLHSDITAADVDNKILELFEEKYTDKNLDRAKKNVEILINCEYCYLLPSMSLLSTGNHNFYKSLGLRVLW